MLRQDFNAYLEEQVRLVTQKIEDDKHAPGDPNDDVSRGKLLVYSSIKNGLKNEKLSNQELGVLGAINDTLQAMGVVDAGQTLMAKLKAEPPPVDEPTTRVVPVSDQSFDKKVWMSPPVDKGGALSVVLFTNGVKATEGQNKKASERASDQLLELANEYNDKVGLRFFEVDYRSNPQIATRFDIQSAPTYLFLQIEEVVGGNTKEGLKAKIDKKMG